MTDFEKLKPQGCFNIFLLHNLYIYELYKSRAMPRTCHFLFSYGALLAERQDFKNSKI